ncbi:MAG: electron transport complex subunit E [Fusobacteriaceae bacterium]|jgi:electron transport complex protein RnfE|nr:electron transport complex subunit E [Fusobacteriaceae bacterium]
MAEIDAVVVNKPSPIRHLLNGIIVGNPTFVLVLGICPTLAVTNAAINGFSMGMAVIFVLAFSNLFISMFRKFIPDQIRIPAFIMIIASLVTIVDLVMKAYFPPLYKALGIFIPLIVVNCIILARAEGFAYTNTVVDSICDGIGTGIGFTLAVTVMGAFREFLGNGTIFGLGGDVIRSFYNPALVMVMAPGGFLTFGLALAIKSWLETRKKEGGE